MKLEKPDVPCDLCETTLDMACAALGASYGEVTLYSSRMTAITARQLQASYGMEVVVVPDAILLSSFTWAVQFAGRLYGSEGAA